jgi:hypothetical protein
VAEQLPQAASGDLMAGPPRTGSSALLSVLTPGRGEAQIFGSKRVPLKVSCLLTVSDDHCDALCEEPPPAGATGARAKLTPWALAAAFVQSLAGPSRTLAKCLPFRGALRCCAGTARSIAGQGACAGGETACGTCAERHRRCACGRGSSSRSPVRMVGMDCGL